MKVKTFPFVSSGGQKICVDLVKLPIIRQMSNRNLANRRSILQWRLRANRRMGGVSPPMNYIRMKPTKGMCVSGG